MVLAWLLKLGGTKRAPTSASSPERPGSFVNLLEVRLEGAITATIKDGLIERRKEAEELELIEGDSLALGEGEGASLTQDGEELGLNEKPSASEGEGDVADLEIVSISLGEGVTKSETIALILPLEESEEDPDPEIVSLSL